MSKAFRREGGIDMIVVVDADDERAGAAADVAVLSHQPGGPGASLGIPWGFTFLRFLYPFSS